MSLFKDKVESISSVTPGKKLKTTMRSFPTMKDEEIREILVVNLQMVLKPPLN